MYIYIYITQGVCKCVFIHYTGVDDNKPLDVIGDKKTVHPLHLIHRVPFNDYSLLVDPDVCCLSPQVLNYCGKKEGVWLNETISCTGKIQDPFDPHPNYQEKPGPRQPETPTGHKFQLMWCFYVERQEESCGTSCVLSETKLYNATLLV